MSIEELSKILESENGKIITTKTILEKGISRYYINKLVENKALEKKEKGKYLVVVKKKRENKQLTGILIEKFKNQVRHNNFSRAYDYLIDFYNLQTTDRSYEYILFA